MRVVYQPEHLDFLRDKYPQMSKAELTQAFNQAFGMDKTESQIKGTLSNHKITCGRSTGALNKGKSHLFSVEEAQFIKDGYRQMNLLELTTTFNRRFGKETTSQQIKSFTSNHGILSGRTGHFEQGNKPWNEGTKGVMQPNSGNFKPGDVPPNRRPIGSERIDTKDGYVYVKTAAINPHTGFVGWWRQKHILAWEAEHGPIPKGMLICFLDGDRTNCEPANLEMISMQENATRNKQRYSSLPNELKPTMRMVAKLQAKRSGLLREVNNG